MQQNGDVDSGRRHLQRWWEDGDIDIGKAVKTVGGRRWRWTTVFSGKGDVMIK